MLQLPRSRRMAEYRLDPESPVAMQAAPPVDGWDQELSVLWPTVTLLCRSNLLLAERFAMRRACILLGRCAVSYMTIDDN